MDIQLETTKLEKLFGSDGSLRQLIPELLKANLFYNRLIKVVDNWEMLKDSILSSGLKVGDALAIYNLLKETGSGIEKFSTSIVEGKTQEKEAEKSKKSI